ncbi:unnamed protein product [Anisakis simplex]|uniref:Serine racemase n=1 Tax=Anisakis simplex TaxID=6269 RepID=A0A0M3JY39_ANISI|nr:unnamed protein product [Anisakis simplex]
MEVNQVTGSFKERGARWALLQLDEKDRKTGVYAASAGNHALALSYHGQQLGIPVNVVMPRHAPIMKIESCGRFGANIRVEGKHMVESRTIGLRLASENHGKYINGYDHVDVIAGAGTVGLEVIEQVMHADVDAVLVPVGGGGLIAGVSLAIKSVFPRVKVIGVEAASCSGFKVHSLEAGKPVLSTSLGTLADGLAVPLIGCNSFATAKDHIDRMVTVSEEDISLAILRLVEYEKVVVEGAGAVGIAALLSGQLNDLKGKKVPLERPLCSDKISDNNDNESGMVSDHRLMRVELVVSDRPGSLAEMANIIAEQGASLHDINKVFRFI